MNIRVLAAMVVAGSMATLASEATEIDGTFSGAVYAAQGSQDGIDLTPLTGLSLTGTFSFNSQYLPLTSGGASSGSSSFLGTNPASPMLISVTVGGDTFSVAGLTNSVLQTSNAVDGSLLFLSTVNANDDIDLSVQGSTPFLSNLNSSGSTKFSLSAPPSSVLGVGEADFNDVNTGAGGAALDFFVTAAAAGPVRTAQAPEIDTATAASGLTLLLGALAVIFGRRTSRIV